MPKPDKKQRHEAKRKAKRAAIRRRDSVSPVKRLANSDGELECWMSQDFEEFGQAEIFVFKRGAGLTGVACFLVDQGVVGLKDAWTRMGVTRDEFQEMLDASRDREIPMVRVGIEDARRRIAGGIRWAHGHGMRLPKDWAKPASFIGGVGDWASADVSEFVKEFAGHPEDLRQRLIGEPLDTFLQRTDIDFIFDKNAPYMDQRTGEYSDGGDESEAGEAGDLEELSDEDISSIIDELPEEEVTRLTDRFGPPAAALAADTADWLKAQNETPSPELLEAWKGVMLASMLAKAALPNADDDKLSDVSFELMRGLSGLVDDSQATEHHRAVDQILEHLLTDPLMMQKAVLKYGLADEPGGAA